MDILIKEIKDVETKGNYIEELFFRTSEETSVDYVATYLDPKCSSAFFAAFDNNELIGLIDGRRKERYSTDVGYIHDFIILSKYKETEVANKLYLEIEKHFRNNNCVRIIAELPYWENDEEWNNELYQYKVHKNNGFKDIEIFGGLYPDTEFLYYRRMIKYLD